MTDKEGLAMSSTIRLQTVIEYDRSPTLVDVKMFRRYLDLISVMKVTTQEDITSRISDTDRTYFTYLGQEALADEAALQA